MTLKRSAIGLLVLLAARAHAATDPSFLLHADAVNFADYFPGQLGNGYASVLTAPRGTEDTPAYLVAFMDRTPGDMARPAVVPAWSGIDYRTGNGHWLNHAPLDAAHFRHYRQTLDMYDGTLRTHYRFDDGGRSTGIDVTSLVSQASPHLAASQLTITPHFDGLVRLSFALDAWAPHRPRFALAKLDGEQVNKALAAHHLTLQPVAPATPDRAALWYPGTTEVIKRGGDRRQLTLWLDGRAAHGANMAEAVAVSLPQGVQPVSTRLKRDGNHFALELVLKLRSNRHYRLTKFVAVSRQGWGGDAHADLALALRARTQGFAALLRAQQDAWHALWRSDVVIDGDPAAQRIVHADLYYLLSNVTPATGWATGACGMTPGYAGHVFWDSDSWVFPALLLLHPRRAESLVMFRARTLPAAEARARARGLRGAMYPWEADPDNGSSQTPYSAHVLDETEIHVDADIALAQWQYYLASGDRAWLTRHGWPVIRALADFWVSRASYDPVHHRYGILHVTSVQENHNDIPNDTYTNASARRALQIASAAAAVVGVKPDPRWAEVASGLYLPFSTRDDRYLAFDPSVPQGPGSDTAGSLPLLSYPSLDLPMRPSVRRHDYAIAAAELAPRKDLNSMALAPLSIAAATVDDTRAAADWFQRNLQAHVIKPPFDVRTETPTNNTGYFLTASGGFLQNLEFGFTGLRIRARGLVAAYPPVLPAGWSRLTLKHVSFRGRHYDISVRPAPDGKATLSMTLLSSARSTSP
ncbi:glycoside hydrolase family 65 protein [Dyella sp. A6]|uniref:glycoside hydrolase family 65 protein n=1 Tax=Dyella aluminiiresistens TaxID=3069105 RepID=UPI002E7882D4|nr:glycoside hydrolase family 65 protein [Dyella sp. A6]